MHFNLLVEDAIFFNLCLIIFMSMMKMEGEFENGGSIWIAVLI